MKLPRNAQLWFPGWLDGRRRIRAHRFDPARPVTVHVLFADHFEPYWRKPADDVARARVADWTARWPAIADRHRDDAGEPAKWTFFYPEEEYRPGLIDALAGMARAGIGDVEVHIHHDGEGEANFVERMQRFVERLSREHGLLHAERGQPTFGFIHGNWALDNARPDGRWCGLNHEITLLRRLGCYADFTGPAAPDICQTRLVNAIYWAVDDPDRPKSHDSGTIVTSHNSPPPDALLCVQGPLTLRAHPRWRVVPSLEVGELARYAAPSPARARAWLNAAPRIGNDVFVKLFTHGATEGNAAALLGGHAGDAIEHLRRAAHSRGWRLAFATAWEMYRAVHRANGATAGDRGASTLGSAVAAAR